MIRRLLLLLAVLVLYDEVSSLTIDSDNCDASGSRTGCFRVPVGCSPASACTSIVKYEDRGDVVHFELGRNNVAVSANKYVAIGFSLDEKMGQDGVTACASGPDGQPTVVAGFNPGTSNNLFSSVPPDLFTNIETGVENGFMVCKFNQKVEPSGIAADAAEFFKLRGRPYHLLLAVGDVVSSNPFKLGIHSLASGSQFPAASKRLFLTSEGGGVPGNNAPVLEPVPPVSGGSSAGIELPANCDGRPQSGCFREPPGCAPASSCVAVVKYQYLGGDRVRFEIGRSNAGAEKYVAVGFSLDRDMGEDAVTACISKASGLPQVVAGYNDGKANKLYDNTPSTMYINVATSVVNGFMVCKFDQQIEPVGLDKLAGNAFNLNKRPYNLLLAVGSMSASDSLNELQMHSLRTGSEYPKASSDPIYFTPGANNQVSAVTIPPPGQTLKAAQAPSVNPALVELWRGCDKNKTCFTAPSKCSVGSDCTELFSFKKADEPGMIQMELGRKLSASEVASPTQKYVAVGFSDDNKMGKDFVTACIFDGNSNTPVVRDSYNPGYTNSDKDTLQSDIQLVSAKVVDSFYYCQFKRKALVMDSQQAQVANLSKGNSNYLFLAKGVASNFNLNKHKSMPFVSKEKLDVSTFTGASVDGEASCVFDCSVDVALMKAHAILMLIGWGFFVPIAILFARYFRNAWATSMPTGVKTWFFMHRTFNAVGWLCFIAAFIIVFVAKQKWVGIEFGTSSMNHAILGLSATIIGFFQPFNALCRCAPTHKSRPIFNWIHRILGFVGLALALAAIGVAYNFIANHRNATYALMLLYIVALGVALIILEIHLTITERLKKHGTADTGSTQVPMQAYQYDQHGRPVPMYTYSSTSHDASLPYFKSWWAWSRLAILGLFALIAIAVVITLAVFIGTTSPPS